MNIKQTYSVALALFLLPGLLAAASLADVIDFTAAPYSAVGDGTTDNRAALAKALAALESGDTLVIPPGTYRVVLTKDPLRVPAGVTLSGQRGKSKFTLLSSEGSGKHREFLKVAADVTVQGLAFQRAGDYPMVMFPVFGDLRNVAFRNCTIDGGKSEFPAKYCHAFQVGVGHVREFTLHGLEVTNCDYGLFQANEATGRLTSVLVEQCLFHRNRASDLEFNSPRGEMHNIVVRNSVFRDNLCGSPSAGFAVGFAHVTSGRVENCHIRNYGSEALHVEDRSRDIYLSGNTIVGGSMKQSNGVIMVLSDSSQVVVDANFVDGRPNENRPHLVLVTAGGQQFKNPSHVRVTNNVLVHGDNTRTWYLQPGSGPDPSGNVVVPAKRPEDAEQK